MSTYESDGYLTTAPIQSDGEAVELQTDTTIPTSTAIDVTVFQDESGGTSADTQQTVTLAGGSETHDLTAFAEVAGATYWLRFDLSTSDSDATPTVSSATAPALVTLESSVSTETAATTALPAPTGLTSPTHTATTVGLDWSATHNNGTTRVEYRPSDESAWTTDQTVDRTTETATVDGLRTGEAYDLRVVAETEHTEAADTS